MVCRSLSVRGWWSEGEQHLEEETSSWRVCLKWTAVWDPWPVAGRLLFQLGKHQLWQWGAQRQQHQYSQQGQQAKSSSTRTGIWCNACFVLGPFDAKLHLHLSFLLLGLPLAAYPSSSKTPDGSRAACLYSPVHHSEAEGCQLRLQVDQPRPSASGKQGTAPWNDLLKVIQLWPRTAHTDSAAKDVTKV